ncbi:AAA family ATPase [Streptomyces sp. HNM0574]|uniref:ATP-binding protein n=1 Tax=Streptomyces sp. HNM0574 TaxID=2714954 RepID=UPI00146E0E90|nr:AAA family ATPase [Streptomyces sp. HNM0574]NLU66346.1 regulator [Streptomyces sp. HNM0574]
MRPFQRPEHSPEPSPARPRTRGNLPGALSGFVGRETEVAALSEQLTRARLTTVTGAGGTGKTRLALRAAERVQDRFSDGVWYVGLAALRDGGTPAHTVIEALGLQDSAGGPPRSVLREHFAGREALLFLDDAEHLAEECAELAAGLLRHAPGLRMLVASRRPLHIAGERLFPLGPLGREEAVELFTERARGILPGFAARGRTLTAVTDLCARLDGIPLALELAAEQLRALSVEQIGQRLDDRFGLLAGGDRSALPRHRTLRTAIGWSHELCTAQERLLWARLSVFAGDFDLEAAEYLCAGGDLPVDRVLPALASLVAQSVVVRTGPDVADAGDPSDRPEAAAPTRQARYHLLETLREYGALWLEELGEAEWLRRRHRDWYLGLATWCELDWFSPRQDEIAAHVDQELPNLRLALEYCLEYPEEAHTGQYLAATLWFYWLGCGRLAEGQAWLDRALAWSGDQPEARAKALWVSGLASLLRGDLVAALGVLHECLELAEANDDETAAVYARQMLGLLALARGEASRAKALLSEVLDRFRALGELNTLVILALVQLAVAHLADDEPETALTLADEARDIAADSDEQWARSYALYALAQAHARLGSPERAHELTLECLAAKRAFHDVFGTALALQHLAALTVPDEPERAGELLGAAGEGLRTLGALRPGPRSLEEAGIACRDRVREALGEEAARAAFRRGRELGPRGVTERELLRHPAATRRQENRAGTPRPWSTAGVLRADDARRPAVPPPPA